MNSDCKYWHGFLKLHKATTNHRQIGQSNWGWILGIGIFRHLRWLYYGIEVIPGKLHGTSFHSSYTFENGSTTFLHGNWSLALQYICFSNAACPYTLSHWHSLLPPPVLSSREGWRAALSDLLTWLDSEITHLCGQGFCQLWVKKTQQHMALKIICILLNYWPKLNIKMKNKQFFHCWQLP